MATTTGAQRGTGCYFVGLDDAAGQASETGSSCDDKFTCQAPAKADGSLQAAFERFRNQRRANLQQAQRKAQEKRAARTPEQRQALRQRFLQQIKSYMGIPYSRKYHRDPSSPHYDAPLYLDCCGLVRQALRDLEKEFGFSVGPWNQAYQFDTLPVALTPETMQPGDLVFISGDYFRPTKRTQRHQMVHVEVWLGEGEKTIGARHQTGVIQVHDSYKFVSKSYGNMQFYFRSIDTWLDGVCKSHCTEHDWLSKAERRNKYSLFGTSGIEASQDLLGNAQDATDTAREEEADQDADIAASDDDELE